MKRRCCSSLLLLFLLLADRAIAKDKNNRLVFTFDRNQRTVYFYIPPDPGERPVVVLLHGSGRDGTEMLNAWRSLAVSEHLILAAPNSLNPSAWDSKYDPPAFPHAVVDQVKALHPVDARRVYLFGHSGGAVYALALALVDSEFYAATAVHAGALPEKSEHLFTYSKRQMPIALWAGDHDPLFTPDRIAATRAQFAAHDFPLQVNILAHHGHDYAEVSDTVNRQAWEFFKNAELPGPPTEDSNF